MSTTTPDLQTLLALGEQADFEAKLAQGRDGRGTLPQSFWETYVAMANTDGGRIALGVRELDDATLEAAGIPDTGRVRKQLWDGLNNRQIVSANLLAEADVRELRVDERVILLVDVPRARRQDRPLFLGANPLNGTFRRGYEGDYRCSSDAVRRMMADASEDPPDRRLLDGFTIADLDPETLTAWRREHRGADPDHPWLGLTDEELLRNLGGWRKDRQTGQEGLALAGLLMFGKLPAILEACPRYLLDYRELPRRSPDERWIDRVTTDGSWSGNLFDFYRRIRQKLTADLRVPFRLEGGTHRVDDTHVHEALREALVNTLIHADYAAPGGVLVMRHPAGFGFKNPGTLRVPLRVILQGGVSDCRNPTLQKMFQLAGAGEQAGSGFARILRAWAEEHWRVPVLSEDAELELTVLLLEQISLLPRKTVGELSKKIPGFSQLDEHSRLALVTAELEGRVTNARMQQVTDEHPADLTHLLRRLVDQGLLVPGGRGRGQWYALPGVQRVQTGLLSFLPGSEQEPSRSEQEPSRSEQEPSRSEQEPSRSEQEPSRSEQESSRSEQEQVVIAADHPVVSAVRKARRSAHAADVEQAILVCCRDWLTLAHLAAAVGRGADTLRVHYLRRMLRDGRIELRYPNRPNHPEQAYRAARPQHDPLLTSVTTRSE